jgi:hypothetical protein
MAYGKADMKFIQETTGISEDIQVWEDIPLDCNIAPSDNSLRFTKKTALSLTLFRRLVVE